MHTAGGPDSDFEYSTQSYTGYEPTSMRAIRARYHPYVQARCRIHLPSTLASHTLSPDRKPKKQIKKNPKSESFGSLCYEKATRGWRLTGAHGFRRVAAWSSCAAWATPSTRWAP
jgi:hypothetical protein